MAQEQTSELEELRLAIQRRLDSDLLLEEQAAPLLAVIEVALASPVGPDDDLTRDLTERLARLTESTTPEGDEALPS